jgi:hypothetical protein
LPLFYDKLTFTATTDNERIALQHSRTTAEISGGQELVQ